MRRTLLSLAMAVASIAAHADNTAVNVKVTQMYVYPEFGNGDVAFGHAGTPVPGCVDGYWLSPSQPGFRQSYAYLLSAVTMGKEVTLYSDTGQRWTGSGGQFCKLSGIRVHW